MGNMAAYFATMRAKQAAMPHAESRHLEAQIAAVDRALDAVTGHPAAPSNEGFACPKCGKPLKAKGRHLHIRACREP